MKLGTIAFLTSLAAGCVVTAHEVRDPEAEARTAKAEFELLKSLEGEWIGTANQVSDARVTYSVTAGDSAVLERLFPGTEHEMVTMYHLDHGKLMLTHYCAAGNQPSMVAEAGPAKVEVPLRLTFECSGATNVKSENDAHMHRLQLFLEERDHLFADWTFHEGGQATHTASFDLRRAPQSAKRDAPTSETRVVLDRF